MCIDARVAFFPSLAQRFVTYRSAGGQGSAGGLRWGSGLVFNSFIRPGRTLRCECRPPVNREGEKD